MSSFKDRLPHAWDAFLSRFGRPTAIQQSALEPLLAGKNCLLNSATAGGKTEAAFAPLVERLKRSGSPSGLSILVIAPTRALTADLQRRLAGPLERAALRLAVKTGDTPDPFAKFIPEILITTPESFDSLLANRPRSLVGVTTVVLDEIHALDNTPRGDHLRILLNRLRRLKRYAFEKGDAASPTIQYCAMSATVDAPETLARRYFPDPTIVSVPGNRSLTAEFELFDGELSLRALFSVARLTERRKFLIFCRTRAESERWATTFAEGTPFGGKVFVHHGSLAAHERRRVEAEFLNASAAVCFATNTLELGIDIGDVDCVALIGPPDSLASFLQRIGRGNRRTDRTEVVCFSSSDFEEAVFLVYVRAAVEGRVSVGTDAGSAPEYWFRPSIVVQQLFSYVKQTPKCEVPVEVGYELFVETDGRPLLPRPEYEDIVDGLVQRDFFQIGPGKTLRPAEAWHRLHEERRLHSNIEGKLDNPIEVRDGMTGRKLGDISYRVKVGDTFTLAGKRVVATETSGRRVTVKPAPPGGGGTVFSGSRGTRLSPAVVAAVVVELGLPACDSNALNALHLAEPDEDGGETEKTILYHHSGEADGLVLGALLAEATGLELVAVTDFECIFAGTLPETELRITPAQVERTVTRLQARLNRRYEFGSFHSFLPNTIRTRALFNGFGVERFVRTFLGKPVRFPNDDTEPERAF